MSLFIASAQAQPAGQPPPGGELFQILFLVGLFVLFYFIAIRPQRKRQKEHADMVSKLNKGDEVVTQGGLHGRVAAVDGEVLEVEIARVRGEKVKVRVSLSRVDQLTKAWAVATR